MWPVPFLAKVEKASDVLSMPPGAFFFWPERQYLEITYDELQAETAAISYLGRLKGDVGWLRDYAERNRQQQGREIFSARLFVKGSDGLDGVDPKPGNDTPWGRLHFARVAAWQEQPQDVDNLLARRGLNIPYGPLSMAESEARKLHELLWRLWNDEERYQDEQKSTIAAFAIEAAITRIGGFCHMTGVGARLEDGLAILQSGDIPLTDGLEELVLYIGRIAAWLDLHICWWPMNEVTRSAIEGLPITNNLADAQ